MFSILSSTKPFRLPPGSARSPNPALLIYACAIALTIPSNIFRKFNRTVPALLNLAKESDLGACLPADEIQVSPLLPQEGNPPGDPMRLGCPAAAVPTPRGGIRCYNSLVFIACPFTHFGLPKRSWLWSGRGLFHRFEAVRSLPGLRQLLGRQKQLHLLEQAPSFCLARGSSE
jgi:hypothetical protein